MKQSAKEFAEQNGLDLKELSSIINMMFVLSDCMEMYSNYLNSEFKKLGANLPGFNTDVLALQLQCRGLVKKVNKYCEVKDVENFGHDADLVLKELEKFRNTAK